MKIYLVITVIITLIVGSECGIIEGFYNTFKNTTHAIKEDISGALHYGKDMVFGKQENNGTVTEIANENIFGRITHKIHDVSQHIKNSVHNFFVDKDGNTIIGRTFNRMKNHFVKIKGYFIQETLSNKPESFKNDTMKLREKIEKYFLSNKTSSETGLQKSLKSMKQLLENIRNNITRNDKNADGIGLIDIRSMAGPLNELEAETQEFNKKITNAIEKDKNSINNMKKNTQDFIENQRNGLSKNYNDLTKMVNENVGNSINNLGENVNIEANKLSEIVKKYGPK